MTDLTARQYALLVDIDGGHVEADWYGNARRVDTKQRLSFRVNELRKAGLASRRFDTVNRWAPVELTATGRNVLDKHRAALMDEVTG